MSAPFFSGDTATLANVSDTATSTTLFAANPTARIRTVWNDSTAVLYLKCGTTAASATSCTVKLIADAYYEFPRGQDGAIYRGQVTGVWASDASGAARTTEVS